MAQLSLQTKRGYKFIFCMTLYKFTVPIETCRLEVLKNPVPVPKKPIPDKTGPETTGSGNVRDPVFTVALEPAVKETEETVPLEKLSG